MSLLFVKVFDAQKEDYFPHTKGKEIGFEEITIRLMTYGDRPHVRVHNVMINLTSNSFVVFVLLKH